MLALADLCRVLMSLDESAYVERGDAMPREGPTETRLPDCEDLFLQFFDPWYDEGDRERKRYAATRPDAEEIDAWVGRSAVDLGVLSEDGKQAAADMIEGMLEAAQGDWPGYLDVEGEVDSSWVEAFDSYYDRRRTRKLIDRSDPKGFSNDYLVIACEFGAVLGHVMRAQCPRLEWLLEWPYWESSLFDPRTGTRINVFHWSVKKLSEYGVDDGYVAKTAAVMEMVGA